MSIAKTFNEGLQKSIRSLEIGRAGLGFAKDFAHLSLEEIRTRLAMPSSERVFLMYEALRRGMTPDELYKMTYIGTWFIEQMKELVDFEERIRKVEWNKLADKDVIKAKELGFADKYLARLFGVKEDQVRKRRLALGKRARYEAVPVSGVENAAYYYSTYSPGEDAVPVSQNKKVMILGAGPNRIGQGIEFDYTCVHAAFALRDEGYESIMVNCNPETVSTDYDTSDKLYFEPVTVEDVLSIYEKERPIGVITQFGGQTPLNIAAELKACGVNILGTSPESIALAEDRELFRRKMIDLGIPQPESQTARSLEGAVEIARKIGYPLMVRPSFVLGGRGMLIIYDEATLVKYAQEAINVSPEYPMLIDRFLEQAIEAEVDALCDGKETFVAAIMEHIEEAGIHSGDSACVIPPRSIKSRHITTIMEHTDAIARELGVVGLINIQFAVCDDKVYVLEANPRASRTVPLVSKVTGILIARIATQLMLGKTIRDFPELKKKLKMPMVGVKEAVFPFNMFPEVDPVLGPEMRATGEVMGAADTFEAAFFKAEDAVGAPLPLKGTVLVTIRDTDKKVAAGVAGQLAGMGFSILATENTSRYLTDKGVANKMIMKISQGRPNIADAIINKEVHLIINTPAGKSGKEDDSYIRKMAIQYKLPYITTMAAAKASVAAIEAMRNKEITPKSLQEYHQAVRQETGGEHGDKRDSGEPVEPEAVR